MKADAIVIYEDFVCRDAFPDRVKNVGTIGFDKNRPSFAMMIASFDHDLVYYCNCG